MLEAVTRWGAAGADVSDESSLPFAQCPIPGDDSRLDVDAVVAEWCAERQLAMPTHLARRTELHVEALEDLIRRTGRDPPGVGRRARRLDPGCDGELGVARRRDARMGRRDPRPTVA